MFLRSVVLHGGTGTLIWGYQEAAVFRSWRIVKGTSGWQLSGVLASFNAYCAGKTPLYFTAPRDKGRWCWPVVGELVVNGISLTAPLGPPEQ